MKGTEVWWTSSKSEVKWIEVKCSDVRWSGAVGNLNGVKPNERVVKCSWVNLNERKWSVDKRSEVEWSVVGWSLNERRWSVEKRSEVGWSVAGWSLKERKWSVNKRSEVELGEV